MSVDGSRETVAQNGQVYTAEKVRRLGTVITLLGVSRGPPGRALRAIKVGRVVGRSRAQAGHEGYIAKERESKRGREL